MKSTEYIGQKICYYIALHCNVSTFLTVASSSSSSTSSRETSLHCFFVCMLLLCALLLACLPTISLLSFIRHKNNGKGTTTSQQSFYNKKVTLIKINNGLDWTFITINHHHPPSAYVRFSKVESAGWIGMSG